MIPLSKVFLRRLIDRAHSVVNLNHFVHLTIWERDDLDGWFRLFDQWNGRCLFYFAGFEPAPNVFVSTDYAGRLGFGAIFKNEWFAGKWPDGSSSLSIAVKELIPIVLAAQIWGCQWKHRIVEFKCDNLAVVSCSQGCFCKDRHLAFLLRELSIVAILSNFSFTSSHISGSRNCQADALSRFKFQEFFQISGSSNVRNESVVQHAALSGVSSLDQKWQYLLSKSLADSTQKTYCSAQKCFVEFCIQFSLFNRNGSILPASELTILRFIGVLSERRQPSTIRAYLSAVRSLHIIHGFSDPLIGSCRIPMALKGAKRVNA